MRVGTLEGVFWGRERPQGTKAGLLGGPQMQLRLGF